MKKIFSLLILPFFIIEGKGQNDLRSICLDSTKDDIKASISFYSNRLLSDSSDQTSYYMIGMSYYKLKEYSLAIKYFDLLIHLNPIYTGAFANRGICKLFLQQIDNACKDFEQSIKYGHDPTIINGQTLSEWRKSQCLKTN